jgi:hypothetical protein
VSVSSTTQDHRNAPLSVIEIFSMLLHRRPSEEEEKYWTDQLRDASFQDILRRVASSQEHKALQNNSKLMFVPAGHFYSPIVDCDFVANRRTKLFEDKSPPFGIDLNEVTQLSFVPRIKCAAPTIPFSAHRSEGLRYFYENNAFLYGDALTYSTMILTHRPSRIFEVGCGFSSALALDICDMIPDYEPDFLFIDPHPELATGLIGGELTNVHICGSYVQDIDPSTFDCLRSGDIYFLDTTHVVKTGSDVLFHFDKILPRLASGVFIHLHDIYYPFEYPQSWVLDMKLSWNELYYFKAFMTNNRDYEIIFFNNFMCGAHEDLMIDASPLYGRNGGSSIWLRKR